MKIFYRDISEKSNNSLNMRLRNKSKSYALLRSSVPKSCFERTPELIYLTEFLKCDGHVRIWKVGNGFGGELIFSSMDPKYLVKLKEILDRQFSEVHKFRRVDGFGISSLVMSAVISKSYGIPVGKKEEMKCTEPRNISEAEMIVRAVIDTEGCVDDYAGDVRIGNISKDYLNSYKSILKKWFEISAVDTAPTKGFGRKTNTIAICKLSDIEKLYKICLINPTKQNKLEFLMSSFRIYNSEKKKLTEEIKNILKRESLTINDISAKLNLAPVFVKRLLRTSNFKRVGIVKKRRHVEYLWGLK